MTSFRSYVHKAVHQILFTFFTHYIHGFNKKTGLSLLPNLIGKENKKLKGFLNFAISKLGLFSNHNFSELT